MRNDVSIVDDLDQDSEPDSLFVKTKKMNDPFLSSGESEDDDDDEAEKKLYVFPIRETAA